MEWNKDKFKVNEDLMDIVEEFPHDKVGITFNSDDYKKEIDYFELFFTPKVYETIISESNRYFEEKYIKPQTKYGTGTWQYQYLRKKIDLADFKSYLAVLLGMSIIELPQKRCYWSKDPKIKQEYIASIMPRLRFEMITAALHLKEDVGEMQNNLTKITPFISLLSESFTKNYIMSQNIAIDESMIAFKGRSEYRFYMPMKPVKFGFKLHCLCESDTGYCYNYILDVGKKNIKKLFQAEEKEEEVPKDYINYIVETLMKSLPFSGYNLFLDSWYNSVEIAKRLAYKGFTVTGTIKSNASNLPKTAMKINLKLGEKEIRSSDLLSFTRWTDKKEMKLISSIYSGEKQVNHGKKDKEMPEVVKEYTTYMRGVDIMDQHLESLNIKQKSNKWWKPIFYHIFEITINNAFILFSQSKREECRYKFKTNLIEQLQDNLPRKETGKTLYFDLYKLHTTEKSKTKKRCRYCKKIV